MFEAKFKLKHGGCWTGGLSKFKSEFVTHITVSLTKDYVQDITEVFLANKEESLLIKNYFSNSKLIRKYEILQESDKKLLVQIFTDTSKITSVVHTVLKNKCFVSNKIPLADGWEIWTIASPNKKDIRNAIEDIKKLGNFKLLKIAKSSYDGFNLSEKQELAIKTAFARGYYNFPRKISAQELAVRLKIDKSTFLEHLRKAEIKIISRVFGI